MHPTIVGALTYVEKFRDQPIVTFFASIRHIGRPVGRILAKKCHYQLVTKLLHACLDLLQKIHGRDMNCSSDVATCAVLTAQVDNNHILLIPKLGRAEKKNAQSGTILWQQNRRKPELSDEQNIAKHGKT